LEVGDTAGLETCATQAGGRCLEKSSRFVTILTDSSAKKAGLILKGEGRSDFSPLKLLVRSTLCVLCALCALLR
jgi:hypothetical protein